MRKFLALALAMATFAVASCEKENKESPYNPDGSPITQEQALEIVKEDVDMYDYVYVSKSIIKKGTKIKTLDREGRVPIDSWVVIINTEPQANSGPFWLYIYVDAYTGNADRDSWEWGESESFECEIVKNPYRDSPTAKANPFSALSETRSSSTVSVSNNWAVIISGGHSPQNNYERYWNDCSAIYKCLRQVLGVNSL